MQSLSHRCGSGHDVITAVFVENAQAGVRDRGSLFDSGQRMDQLSRDAVRTDGEVLE